MFATISADIVSSTSLSVDDIMQIRPKTTKLFDIIENKYPDFWGRLVKGDYIECITQEVAASFRIALIIKCFVKAFISSDKFGARIAIGIGDMRIVDRKHDLLDGEAIYLSGRAINSLSSQNKAAFTIEFNNPSITPAIRTIATLTDALINILTKRQSEVIFYKLLGFKETDIATAIGIKQSGVSKHASSANWTCIEDAVKFFENLNLNHE